MAITCKDENGKEIKIEVPWEKLQTIKEINSSYKLS